MKPWLLLVPVLALAASEAGVTTRALASEGPTAVIKQTTDAIVQVLENKALSTDEKRRQIEQVVYQNFDFSSLSRLVLARNWKRLTPAQQKEFTEEFKKHLSLTYGRNVESYNKERVVITGERQEARGDWTVKSKIARPGGQDVLVDYRLRQQGGTWQVIDVIIEGVSLVANFRSQFQAIVARDGPVKLIELLRAKNAEGEPLES
jgi:phospholipid transport system substrate-binding protein